MIVADGEGHEAVERHFALAVERDQLRADTASLSRCRTTGRVTPNRAAISSSLMPLIGQRLEGVELIGGMHGLADFVFGKADLGRILAVQHIARHRMIGLDLLLLRHQLERGEPPRTGDDLEGAVAGGLHLQVLQQAVRVDAGGKLLDAVHAVGLAHIVGRGDKLREGQILNVHGLTPVG